MHTRLTLKQPCSWATRGLCIQPILIHRPALRCPAAADSGALGPDVSPQRQPNEANQQEAKGLLGKVQEFVLGGKNKKLDRQRLAELGMGAFAAYGVISNLNASVLVTLAWLSVVKTQGVTPLAPGMWPKFLVIYGGLWISSHFMRPIRLSLAIAAAPAFDRALATIMKRTGFNKAGAFAVMLACIAVCSCTLLLTVLTVCGGFPASS